MTTEHPYDVHIDTDKLLIACSFWLRVGFVGASVLFLGLMLLVNGEAKALPALVSAAGGGVLMAFAWKRGSALLDRVDRAAQTFPAAALAAIRNHPLESAATLDRQTVLGTQ